MDISKKRQEAIKKGVAADAARVDIAPTIPLGIPKISPIGAIRLKEYQAIDQALASAGQEVPIFLPTAIQTVQHALKNGRTDGGIEVLKEHFRLSETAAQIIAAGVKNSTQLIALSEKRRPTQDDIRDALAMKRVFYYDADANQYFYGPTGNSDPFALHPFDQQSELLNKLLGELQREGLKTIKRDLAEAIFNEDCYVRIAYLPALLDHLSEQWDGKDYISEVVKTVQTDDDVLAAETFKRWAVNVVAQVYGGTEKHRNDCAFVFVSHEQGIGKTAFFEGLLWDNKWLASVPDFSFTNKEHRLLMSSKLLILLDELGQYKKAEAETIKAGMSQTKITADAKYKSTADYVRNASFAGCSNDDNFLKDDTGDRRFLVFRLDSLDREKYMAINKKQLWGQLARLYKTGFQYHMTREQTAALVKRNSDNFTGAKPEDAFIEERLIITKDPRDFVSSTDMSNEVNSYRDWIKGQSFINVNVIRQKLQGKGVKTSQQVWVAGKQSRGYVGVKLIRMHSVIQRG